MAETANDPPDDPSADLIDAYAEAQAKGVPFQAPTPEDDELLRLIPLLAQRSTAPRQRIGCYELLAELGRGSFGAVYHAWDHQLHREVAIKVPAAVVLFSPSRRQRWLAEAHALAQLDHPNLVKIHHVIDEAQGQAPCCLVLHYCTGGTLKQWLRNSEQAVPGPLAAQIVLTLAEAVEHVHRHGIIHRDLKPENVLLDASSPRAAGERGEKGDNAFPWALKVSDFGLAKFLDDALTATQTGTQIGTPAYMAPEQVEGRSGSIGPATDVYALGAILYELLTQRPPHQGESKAAVLHQVVNEEPLRPRRLQTGVPRDLETICLKCLQKEPAKRYPGAAALAADLRRFQARQPILAKPTGRLERTAKWARRNPLAAALVMAIAVLAVAAAGSITTAWLRAVDSEAEARGSEAKAIAAAEREKERAAEACQQLYVADMRLAGQKLKEGNALALRELLDRHRRQPEGADWRGFAWHYLDAHAQERRPMLRPPTAGKPLLLAHRGETLIGVYRTVVDDTVTVLTGGGNREQLDRRWDVHSRMAASCPVALSPDGKTLAAIRPNTRLRTVTVYEAMTGKPRCSLQRDEEIHALAFSPDSRWLAVGANKKLGIIVWNWADAAQARIVLKAALVAERSRIAFAPDGKTLASSLGTEVEWWDLPTGRRIHNCDLGDKALRDGIAALIYSRTGQLAVSVPGLGTYLCDERGEACELLTSAGAESQRALAFTADGQSLATVGADARIAVWDVRTRTERGCLRWQDAEIVAAAFAPDGTELAAATSEGLVYRLDPHGAPPFDRLEHELVAAESGALAFAPDSRTLAVGGAHGIMYLVDVASYQVRDRWEVPAGAIQQVAFAPDGRKLATLDPSGRVLCLWNARDHTLERRLHPPFCCAGIGLGPSNLLVAVAASETRPDPAAGKPFAIVWDAATGTERAQLFGDTAPITALALAPGGETLATGGRNGAVLLWDLTPIQGQKAIGAHVELHPLVGPQHEMAVTHLAFALHGTRLLSVDRPHGWITAIEGRRLICRGPLPQGGSLAVQFTRDDELMTAQAGGVQFWMSPYLRVVDQLSKPGHWPWLGQAALSPTGQTLAVIDRKQGLLLFQRKLGANPFGLGSWTLRRIGGHGPVHSLVTLPDSRSVIIGSNSPEFEIHADRKALGKYHGRPRCRLADSAIVSNLATGQKSLAVPDTMTLAPPTRLVRSGNGHILAGGCPDGSVWVWDLKARRILHHLFLSDRAKLSALRNDALAELALLMPEYAEPVAALDLDPGGTLACAGNAGDVTLWNAAEGSLLRKLSREGRPVTWLRFAPEGDVLGIGCAGQVELWDVATGTLRATLGAASDSQSLCAAFSPDGRFVVTGTAHAGLRSWDVTTRQEQPRLSGHAGRVTALAFAPNGRTLASGGGDRIVRLWNMTIREEILALEGHRGKITCLAFTPDGRTLVSGSDSIPGEVYCWRAHRD